MTIVSSGAISINSLVGEYGGSAPHSMSEYYRGGGLVLDHSNNANVPTSGTIDLADFYGANNSSPHVTVHNYSMTNGALSILIKGFDSANAFGSLSPNPQSTAFASGWNPTVNLLTTINLKGIVFSFQVNGTLSNSGWTNIVIPASLTTSSSNETIVRTAFGFANSAGNTLWSVACNWEFNATGSGTVTVNA